MTLLVQHDFWNDSLITQMVWLHSPNHGDGILRPKVIYELRDNIMVWVRLDFFYGTRNGLFGQFDQLDRLVVGMEWGI